MKIRMGSECAECGQNTDDRCLHCHEPVCSWEKRPMKIADTFRREDIGGFPLPCYDEHRKGSCPR